MSQSFTKQLTNYDKQFNGSESLSKTDFGNIKVKNGETAGNLTDTASNPSVTD